ncbi:MAG: ATP-binding protein [Promethearchaeota archaeon]
MQKVERKIITIDEELCNGCGNCIPSCPEQALELVDTPDGLKARIVKEFYCDGLGACLGACPTGALIIEEKEVDPYDDDATIERIKEVAPEMLNIHVEHIKEHAHQLELPAQTQETVEWGCPAAQTLTWEEEKPVSEEAVKLPSQLRQWPVQLHLVSPSAPYFQNNDLVIVADCVPFAYANFHQDFLKDKALAVGCPKLDDTNAYLAKIAQIIKTGNPRSVTVVNMEVPCCFGLVRIVQQAMKEAGKNIPFETVTISIKGKQLQ